MNCSTYVFGELSEGYSQYPEDSSSNLFKSIYSKCNAPTQLVIHRDENLMYYVYVRKLDAKKYIGFAVAINGYYFTDVKSLFSLFEEEIEKLAESGIIINYSNDGDLTSTLPSLRKEEEEVMSYVNQLQVKLSNIRDVSKLPQTDYTVSINSQKIFNENNSNAEIEKASYTFGFTIILKQENYDTLRSTSYKSTLKNLHSRNDALTKEIEELRENNKKILRKKKQTTKVIILLLAVILCGIGIYFLRRNLLNTENELGYANNTITVKDSLIEQGKLHISSLRDTVAILFEERDNLEKERTDLTRKLDRLAGIYPFIVTENSVNAERYQIKYYSNSSKYVTVTLKAINCGSSEIVSSVHSISLSEGYGETSLYFDRMLSTSSYYYVVLLYDDKVIAGKYW
ncbi:MAG: hypothetical protein K2M79_06000 [Muribaculaceae bacterium]|nr:hypothetical protein [Muribaculaceae bacterium]